MSPVTDITDRLRGHRHFADQLPDSVDSAELRSAFPNHLYARWLHCCRRLLSAGFGDLVFSAYVRYAPIISKELNPEIALDLTDSISAIAAKTGRLEAAKLSEAAAIAAKHLKNERSYRAWINLIERFAAIAPESTLLLLDQIDVLLSSLSVSRLEAWILAGIRLSGGDSNQRAKFFSFENPESTYHL